MRREEVFGAAALLLLFWAVLVGAWVIGSALGMVP